MGDLVFDIETIPSQRKDIQMRINEKIRPPRTLKKEDSIAAWYSGQDYIDACDEAYEATALNSMFGEICAIGWKWAHRDETHSVVRTISSDMTEKDLLEHFFSTVYAQSQDRNNGGKYVNWIGHNIVAFDMPWLLHRSIITGAQIGQLYLPRNLRPTGNRGVFDTMTEWSGWGKRVSLNDMALALGLGEKTMEAKGVFDCYEQDDAASISEYVRGDVDLTARLYARIISYLGS